MKQDEGQLKCLERPDLRANLSGWTRELREGTGSRRRGNRRADGGRRRGGGKGNVPHLKRETKDVSKFRLRVLDLARLLVLGES